MRMPIVDWAAVEKNPQPQQPESDDAHTLPHNENCKGLSEIMDC